MWSRRCLLSFTPERANTGHTDAAVVAGSVQVARSDAAQGQNWQCSVGRKCGQFLPAYSGLTRMTCGPPHRADQRKVGLQFVRVFDLGLIMTGDREPTVGRDWSLVELCCGTRAEVAAYHSPVARRFTARRFTEAIVEHDRPLTAGAG